MFVFQKRCKVCQSVFYSREISQEQADALAENEGIDFEWVDENDVYTMYSCCPECAKDYYKE